MPLISHNPIPVAKRMRLDQFHPQQWVDGITALVPVNRKYREIPGSKNRNQKVCLREFFFFIFKYIERHDLHVQIDKSLVQPNVFYLNIAGNTADPSVIEDKVRPFSLELNTALEEGVRPEQLTFFRTTYFIGDDDKTFFDEWRPID